MIFRFFSFLIVLGRVLFCGPVGSISGMVMDYRTEQPLSGANIVLSGSILGSSSNGSGKFVIEKVPVGSYTVEVYYIGYDPLKKTDVIVKSGQVIALKLPLKASILQGEIMEVRGGYFQKRDEQPVSTVTISSEEIRRAPGSAGDVSRIMMVMPSTAKVNDQSNSLIVRGGSPMENGFYIDNIEVPNINHFPTQGASGGPIGLVNVDFIRDVTFSAGGFPAYYGDRLSSVMDISFREGNRKAYQATMDLHMAGFGAGAEGPLINENGSWLFSARRSYLDLLVDAIGSGVAPCYSDYQGKVVYDIHQNHQIMFLGLVGLDQYRSSREDVLEKGVFVYGNYDIAAQTYGINWRALWHDVGYSNTSFSYTSQRYSGNTYETKSEIQLLKNKSTEDEYKLRTVNHFNMYKNVQMVLGLDWKHLRYHYDHYFAEYTDALGQATPAMTYEKQISANKLGGFASCIVRPSANLSATVGLRADYFDYNRQMQYSPSAAVTYRISEGTALNASAGRYSQNLPLVLLGQKEEYKKLQNISAFHYVLGLDHLITDNTKLSLEAYLKPYQNFPINPTQPSLFLIDELYYRYGFFFNHEQLVDKGKARTYGIELYVQKKLAENFYGLIGGSYFRSRYQDLNKIWHDRVFDNRLLFSIEGGYKYNRKWEFSLRWIYAGGAPYTPFDDVASSTMNRGILDESRINEVRYPDYHSLNIRMDRRFFFNNSYMILYVSVWNAYNRKNIAGYDWNEIDNKPVVSYQWSMLPIFGVEYEF
jgi:hypothetical protein